MSDTKWLQNGDSRGRALPSFAHTSSGENSRKKMQNVVTDSTANLYGCADDVCDWGVVDSRGEHVHPSTRARASLREYPVAACLT